MEWIRENKRMLEAGTGKNGIKKPRTCGDAGARFLLCVLVVLCGGFAVEQVDFLAKFIGRQDAGGCTKADKVVLGLIQRAVELIGDRVLGFFYHRFNGRAIPENTAIQLHSMRLCQPNTDQLAGLRKIGKAGAACGGEAELPGFAVRTADTARNRDLPAGGDACQANGKRCPADIAASIHMQFCTQKIIIWAQCLVQRGQRVEQALAAGCGSQRKERLSGSDTGDREINSLTFRIGKATVLLQNSPKIKTGAFLVVDLFLAVRVGAIQIIHILLVQPDLSAFSAGAGELRKQRLGLLLNLLMNGGLVIALQKLCAAGKIRLCGKLLAEFPPLPQQIVGSAGKGCLCPGMIKQEYSIDETGKRNGGFRLRKALAIAFDAQIGCFTQPQMMLAFPGIHGVKHSIRLLNKRIA